MVIRRHVANLLVLLLAVFLPFPAVAQSPSLLVIAWVDEGNLYAWQQGGAPRQVAAGGIVRPFVSPDGQRVVFVSNPNPNEYALRVVNIDGTGEASLGLPEEIRGLALHQLAWHGSTTFYFNTVAAADYGLTLGDDLYRADLIAGQVERILAAGEGGNFVLSPDGRWVALVKAGAYASAEGQISLMNLETREKRTPFLFPAVSTGSEYAFYPQVYWEPGSQALRAAVPDPNLILDDTNLQTALWRLSIEGTAQPLGVVNASFFGQPRWNGDASQLLYSRRVGLLDENLLELVVSDGSGAAPTVYLPAAPAGSFEAPRWIPGGSLIGYLGSSLGQFWLGGPGQGARLFPNDEERMFDPLFVGGGMVVFYTPPTDEGSELRYASLDSWGQPSMLIASVRELYPAFSAVLKTG